MAFLNWIKNSFFANRDRWILWLPVIFASGIIFYFYFPNSSYLPSLSLFFFSIFLIFVFQEQLLNLLFIASAVFIAGFLWTKIYTEKIVHSPKIEQKFYATAVGKIDNINSFYNPILRRNAYQIVVKDVALYKAGSIADDVVIKKEKPQKVKKHKKKKVKKKKREKKNKIKKESSKQSVEQLDSELPQETQGDVVESSESTTPSLPELPRLKPRNDDAGSLSPQPQTLSLSENNSDTAIQSAKEEKPKKRKRRKKKSENIVSGDQQNQVSGELKQKIKKPKKKKPPKSKRENKTVIKSYLNVAGYQEIDREFLAVDYKSQNKNWVGNRYINPPQKVILSVNTNLNNAKIGDVIQTRVILEPFKSPYFPGSYDKGFESYFKGIGGSGYAASDLKVLKARNENSFFQDIKILRQNIARKILDQMDEQGGTMAVALLVGAQNLIKPAVMQAMRNSGLSHLISISGLHFTLAAGIFFFSIRFLLSLNQYLVLNYDIKKIAALIAIFTGLFYLLLADMPVPAVRSFIVVALIFAAILLDLKPDAFRSTAFAAWAILIFSPNVIFSVSFQLSFAAILALIVLADLSKPLHLNSSQRPFYLKFFFYFLGIVLSSIAATISTTPFSIYHFNNFISFGALANLAAIPIASFITMPFGFLALLLMPFGIEKIALYPMQISIHWIIDIANYVAAMPHSSFAIQTISARSFGLIIFGGLWFMIWQKSFRLLGFIPILFGIYFAIKTPLPDILIDGEKGMLAIHQDGRLIFLKPTKSKQAFIWAKKLGVARLDNISSLPDAQMQKLSASCNQSLCEFSLKGKRVLVLIGRNKISDLCNKNYDAAINISRKYQMPKCLKQGLENTKIVIDNQSSKKFLYLQ